MIKWTMDPDVYGLPDFGMAISTSREFTAKLGDVGRGRYVEYNATAPIPVNVTFGWRGSVLATFREQWENPKTLAFGAGWFLITLPAYLDRIAPGPYPAHCVSPFEATMAGYDWWKVSMQLDVDPSPALVVT